MTESRREADYRFQEDEQGVVIVRCIAHGSEVHVPSQLGGRPVVTIGAESFASVESGGLTLKVFNDELESVSIPEGVTRIGRAAFRGCSRLSRITLPESLVEIEDLAFSCTSIYGVRLPRSCVQLGELALRTGPESLFGSSAPYLSKLDVIDVDSQNPVYCAVGGVLCRRLEAGSLEAVLCPGKCDELRLGPDVVRVAPSAFAGTYEISTLGFCDSIMFDGGYGLAPQASCRVVEIERAHLGAGEKLRLVMPSKAIQRRLFGSTRGWDAFDLPAFLMLYDSALMEEGDLLLQSKLLIARLAHPVHLSEVDRASFERLVSSRFDSLCVQFGIRNYWEGFEGMVDAGLLDASGISHAIDVLSSRCDTTAIARLLELKQSRFGESEWDYDL